MTDWGVPDWRNAAAYLSPERSLEYWRWQFIRRRPDYREAWSSGETNAKDLLQRFGYSNLDDPRQDERSYWPGELLQVLELKTDEAIASEVTRLSGPSSRLGERWVSIKFDLDQPLRPQIMSAEEALESLQQKVHGGKIQRRRHMKKWPLYLRVIDARDAGETWETIGQQLLGRNPDTLSEGLSVEEYDEQIERSGSAAAARARQVWEHAQEIMFNFPD